MAPMKQARRRNVKGKGKGNRRSRVPRSLLMKPYSYVFKLNPQIISTDGQAFVRIPALSPAAPIKPGTGSPPTTGGIVNYTTASSGFINCVDWGVAFAGQLSDCASANAFIGLYDAYRIDRITVTVQYLSTALAPGTTNGSMVMPTFVMYHDQDDAVNPPDVYSLSRRQGSKRFQPTATKLATSFSFVPRLAVGVGINPAGLSGNGAIVAKPTWIDCATPNVSHYGFKMTCQDFGVPQAGGFNAVRLQYTYHVSFRSPLNTN